MIKRNATRIELKAEDDLDEYEEFKVKLHKEKTQAVPNTLSN
jgi:hypothetical protein